MRKILYIFYRSITSLSFNKLLKLASLNFSHPIFSILSFYATFQSFVIAQQQFPKTSSGNGVGNAFRHALWSCLIMMYCCKISSPKKALDWCKKMTDLHEVLFPNEPLETKMDLHNNEIGMQLFLEMLPGIHRQFFEKNFFIEKLLEKVKTAEVLEHLNDHYPNELVYLNDK